MFAMGMTLSNWIRLLYDNKFKISLFKIHKVIIITFLILVLTPFSVLERLTLHRKIKKTELHNDPIFIVGHWRSGTSHLHNLFTLDQRLAYPNMVDTLFPNHMIFSNWILRQFLSLALPDKRPMDNMALSVDVPGEHDWAISNLCLMTPYSGAYFPNHWENYRGFANFESSYQKEKEVYIKYLKLYLQKLQYKYPDRQLILKSPLDTARISLIKEIFPNAKFLAIHRNPYEVFLSTKKLHTRNKDIYPLQKDQRDLDEFVSRTYNEMYHSYFDHIEKLSSDDFLEVFYEDLISKPVEILEAIYSHLKLPAFDSVRTKIDDYLDSISDYEVDEYIITGEEKKKIYGLIGDLIDHWNYDIKSRSFID